MKAIEVNQAMNAGIVVLNEIKSKKLSSVSGKKRAQLRIDKHAAEFVLANWDNGEILSSSIKRAERDKEDERISEEVLDIWRRRAEELKPAEEPKPIQANKDKEPKEKAAEQVKKVGRKAFRKIGDHHPNHPEWVWTEYKSGVFDWRTDPTMRKKVGRKSGQTAKSPKSEKKAKETKRMTLEEFKALTTPSNLSKAQKKMVKYISRGYTIHKESGAMFFVDKDGENIDRCEKDVLNSLLKKFKIDYIPEGLVK